MNSNYRWTLFLLVGLLAVMGVIIDPGRSAEESETTELKDQVLELTTRIEKLDSQLSRAREARAQLEGRIGELEKGLQQLRTAFENRERSGHFQKLTSEDLSRIRSGMSAEEVRNILGSPAEVGSVTFSTGGGTGESWLYRITAEGKNKSVQVLFQDGKVKTTRGW